MNLEDINIRDSLLKIFLILIFVIAIIAVAVDREYDWNDGYCPNCHVRWEYGGVDHMMESWGCPQCGKIIFK